MTDRRLFPREATDDEIAVEVLASLLGVTIEEARRVMAEENDTAIGYGFWRQASSWRKRKLDEMRRQLRKGRGSE